MQRWPWRASAGAAVPTVLTVTPAVSVARQERSHEPDPDAPVVTPIRLAPAEPETVARSITATMPAVAIVERTGGRLVVRTNSGRAPIEGDGWYVMERDCLRPAVPYEVSSFTTKRWDLVAAGTECALGVFAA